MILDAVTTAGATTQHTASESGDWQQEVDHVPPPVKLDGKAAFVVVPALGQLFERRGDEFVDCGRFALKAYPRITAARKGSRL
jgi:hypothetical protein